MNESTADETGLGQYTNPALNVARVYDVSNEYHLRLRLHCQTMFEAIVPWVHLLNVGTEVATQQEPVVDFVRTREAPMPALQRIRDATGKR